jgi:hypothetical protein
VGDNPSQNGHASIEYKSKGDNPNQNGHLMGISTSSYWLKRKSAITGNMDISNIMHILSIYDNIAG